MEEDFIIIDKNDLEVSDVLTKKQNTFTPSLLPIIENKIIPKDKNKIVFVEFYREKFIEEEPIKPTIQILLPSPKKYKSTKIFNTSSDRFFIPSEKFDTKLGDIAESQTYSEWLNYIWKETKISLKVLRHTVRELLVSDAFIFPLIDLYVQ